MKKTLVFIAFVILAFQNCERETTTAASIIDNFPADKYYDADIFSVQHPGIYGHWSLDDVSGGIHGEGHSRNFETLKFRKNGIYAFIGENQDLEYGWLEVKEDQSGGLLIAFRPDPQSEILMYDPEKYLILHGNDSLSLVSPCCDRYNYHLVRSL